MDGNKFISSEPKSGLSPEEMRGLEDRIDSLKNRIDELNGESLEIKTEMALKNQFISPEQEKELFDLVNSSEDLYKRYHRGERTEDLLAGLANYHQTFERKRNEIFTDPDLVKDGKADNSGDEFKGDSPLFRKQARRFRDVREADGAGIMEDQIAGVRKKAGGDNEEELKKQLDAAYKNLYGFLNDKKDAPKELYNLIRRTENDLRGVVRFRNEVSDLAEQLKEKYKIDERSEEEKAGKGKKIIQEGKSDREKETGKKSGYTKEMIAVRAAEIKQRRFDNQPGFEWDKIDALLRENKIKPGTPEADNFMVEWDAKTARQELIKEGKNEKTVDAAIPSAPRATKEKRDYLKITPKKEAQEKKAELSPEVFGILKSAKDEFYQELQREAEAMEGWGKYKPEQQKTLLGIELETFLRGYIEEECVPRNLVAKEEVEKTVVILMAEKIIETAAPAVLESRVEGEKVIQEIKEPAVGEAEKQARSKEEYTELFKDKSDKELVELEGSLLRKIDAIPFGARQIDHTYTPEFYDLDNQLQAIYQIYDQKTEGGRGKGSEKAGQEIAEKPADEAAVEGYKEIFKNKTDEELVILRKQIEDRMEGIPVEVRDYIELFKDKSDEELANLKQQFYEGWLKAANPLKEDLGDKYWAVDHIQMQRFNKKKK